MPLNAEPMRDFHPSETRSDAPAVTPSDRVDTTPDLSPEQARTGGLRLTRLTLNGFKSFADPTVFTFDDQLTGVVGPNGCGKSNVVDAIKWVLGERSSKSLRGKEMIDVIFAGSAKRKPAGMASVSLAFENPVIERPPVVMPAEDQGDDATEITDEQHPQAEQDAPQDPAEAPALISRQVSRPLPIDTQTVEVERRLYRDGKSQYLINGRIARLRDIRDLFLDTGIGADAYSIIEQGRVDAMLLASPQDRRHIFEEAAGIAKYRARRAETQRKLERTEINLTRTRDQLASTDRRLRMVRGQAAKARRYRDLTDEVSALRLALAFEQYDDIRARLDGLTSQLSKLETERNESQAKFEAAESELQSAQIGRHELAGSLREAEDERTGARHGAEQAEQRAGLAKAAIEEAEQRAEAEFKRSREAEERAGAIAAELEEQQQQIASLNESLAETERRAEEMSTSRAELIRRATEAREALAEHRSRAAGVERERSGLAAQDQAEARRAETLSEQLVSVTEKAGVLASERASAVSGIDERTASVEHRTAAVVEVRAQLDGLRARQEQLGADRRGLAERVATLDERFVRADAKRTTLEEMVRTRAGLSDGARAVLEHHERAEGFTGIVGSLAELIEVDTVHADAVETALGAQLSAVVVRSVAAVPGSEELSALPGRVSFLPLIGLGDAPAPIPEHAIAQLGNRARRALDLVRPKTDAVAPLLARLLGRTLLVDSLDAALMLAAGPLAGHRARFVTGSGEVLESDGRVVGGPHTAGEHHGVIARRSELARLDTELTAMSVDLALERASLEAVDADASALERESAGASARLGEYERALASEHAELDRLTRELDRLTREHTTAEEEGRALRERLDTIATERTDLSSRLERLVALGAELVASLERTEREHGAHEAQAQETGEQLTAVRVEVSRLGEQLGSARRQAAQLQTRADEADRHRAEADRQAQHARERVSEHQSTQREALERVESLRAQGKAIEERVSDRSARLAQADAAMTDVSQRVATFREAATRVERDWHSVESSRRELEVKRETAEERASEDLSVSLADEHEEYRQVMAPGDVEPIDTADAQARVNVLKGEVKRLGNVNLNAIDEETELAGRNEELIAQVDDIDHARVRLATVVEKLDIASRERFGEVFERIKSEFGGRDGMFRRLFGGGRAEVRLMPLVKEVDGQKVVTDEVDLLESGIEVIAKPPGKEPRSISQLSGGEKTLTAVALLMSIFRSKPSCFCILDEVDAALDESNVGRYCSALHDFTDESHFIVVTHNKRTMQSMDRLYGVTMQERGVSKRVAVKLDQVREDGELKKSAVEAEPEPIATAAPESPKTTGNLRAALAGMRTESEKVSSEA
ncbi:MAG: chromosome partition protein Smc [Phycisphaeraceae bacterium]|nr:MAG: chromosome partition protein Smc [Phycisphaeraceae bacterium]